MGYSVRVASLFICFSLCSFAPVGGMASAASTQAAGTTRVDLDLYSIRTGTLRHLVRQVPTSRLRQLTGGPQEMPPSPRLLRDARFMAGWRARKLARPAGLDEPGRSPAQAQKLAAGKTPQRVSGSWKALVLLADFSDKTPTSYAGAAGPSHFASMLFSTGSYSTGSMNDYYREVSYNQFQVSGLVSGGAANWYRAPQTYAYYVDGNYGTDSPYPHNCKKLVEDLVDLADPNVNFANYDNDGDGYVDALFVVHAGPGAEATGDPDDIWSHKWSIASRVKDGKTISVYSIEPESGNIGVFCHEFGHVLGLPDLYDTDNSSEGIGNWSLMAGGSWGGDGIHDTTPAHPDPWSRIQLGWVTPTVPTSNLTGASLPRVEYNPTIYKLWTNGAPGTEYFLVENRQKVAFDLYLPNSGLCIWHIDTAKTSNTQEWYPGLTATSHYKVALEPGDGLWHLEHNENRGDAGDTWPGSTGKYTFNGSSTPNTNAYTAGATTVSVSSISASAATMTANLTVRSDTAPQISVVINSGASSTGSAGVTLTLATTGGGVPVDVRFANGSADGSPRRAPGTWSAWQTWATSKSWTLAGGYGTKTVYAQARNSYGSGTEASDTIVYQAPTPLLLVADGGTSYRAYYEAALTAIGATFTVWDVASQGAVTSALLSPYAGSGKAVIWFTGSEYSNTLTSSDQTALAAFLNAGGRLFVSGQDILYNIGSATGGFAATYLHASYVQDDTNITTLRGVSGDPIAGAWSSSTLNIAGGDGAGNQNYPSEVNPLNGAQTCLSYYTGSGAPPGRTRGAAPAAVPALSPAAKARGLAGSSSRAIAGSGTAGLRVDTGVYKVVYFAFGFEAISTAANRSGLMQKVLSWFGNATPPAPATVTVTPASPKTGDDLHAVASGDPDPGGTIVYEYQWSKIPSGGTSWGSWGNPGATLSNTLTASGEQWSARARACSGGLYSSWTGSNVVFISDTSPTAPGKPVITPAAPHTDNDLTATWTAAADADGDAVTYAYQWLRNGSAVAGQSGTTTSLSTILSRAQTTKGEQWSLSVAARSGSPVLSSPTVTSDPKTVVNAYPGAPASASVAPASPSTDDDLLASCGAATDFDPDTLTYSFQWAKSSDGGTTWGAWGNNGATLPRALTTRGDRWKTRARAYDGTDWGAFTESAVVTVGDTAPTSPGKPAVTPASPRTDDDLTATWTAATDADGDSLVYVYQWLRNGAAVAGQSGTTASLGVTLLRAQTTRGDRWSLSVRAQSVVPALSSAAVVSDEVTVGNTAPEPPVSATISPASPATDDDLSVSHLPATDADGDALTYTCEWRKSTDGGATWGVWGLVTGTTVSADQTSRGDLWMARARAHDGIEAGGWRMSTPVTVTDAPPTAVGKPSLAPASPVTDDDLIATWPAATDPDGDPVTYAYQWLKGGSPVAGQDGATSGLSATLPRDRTAKGDQWSLSVTAQSGTPTLSAAATTSDSVTVVNTVPGAPALAGVTPADPDSDDDLTATFEPASDVDGDPLSYSCEWARSADGGGSWGAWGNPGPTLARALATRGESWKARVRAHDGADYGDWTESAAVTIADSAPSAPGQPALSPPDPRTDDDLTATWAPATDADGDAITYSYRWLRDGLAVAGESGVTTALSVTLDRAQTAQDEQWTLSVTAQAGALPLTSPASTSAPVTIVGTPPEAPGKPTLAPADPLTADDLTATWTASTDADGDAIVYTYQWLCNGAAVAGQSGTTTGLSASLPQEQTTKGDRWSLSVTAQSGTPVLSSAAAASDEVAIGNTAPGAPTAAAVSPASPLTDDDLVAVAGAATDADGGHPQLPRRVAL